MASLNDRTWATRPNKLPTEQDMNTFTDLTTDVLNMEEMDLPGGRSESNAASFAFKTMHDMDSLHSRQSVGSNPIGTNYTYIYSTTSTPLSWKEARMKFRDVLRSYMDCSSKDIIQTKDLVTSCSNKNNIKKFWFSYNLDCYFGSILASLSFLILSVILYTRRGATQISLVTNVSHGESLDRLYISHITASTILLCGSVLSVWLLRRRHISNARGAETKKRNTIETFLPTLNELINCHDKENDGEADNLLPSRQGVKLRNIPGTSLTDIYPVYRLDSDGRGGKWHKIPSLLLVEGDFIALQLGDTAPADCTLVTGSKFGPPTAAGTATTTYTASATAAATTPRNLSAPNLRAAAVAASASSSMAPSKVHVREPVMLKAGDRVELKAGDRHGLSSSFSTTHRVGTTVQLCDPMFLPGKSKVAEHSKKLLHLTNHSKVFQVTKSPIVSFLHRKTVQKNAPLIHRKLKELRFALYCFSVLVCILSYVIISIRYSIDHVNISIILHLPLIAALGCLPVITPLVIILLEVIGTSHILVTVHPYSSNVKKIETKLSLFWHYVLRGIDSRLELGKFSSNDGFLDFPVASSCLYEKLGVVTTLALIDDELACDPVSTPQQLLIPTTNGLKLLDLFPKYEEESDNDSNEDEKNASVRKRARSFASSNDSDSEWGDEPTEDVRFQHHGNRMRGLVKVRRRFIKTALSKKKLDPPKLTEVQFEEPNWWHYLPSLKCIGLAGLLIDNKGDENKNSKSMNMAYQTDKYAPGTAESALVHHVSQYYDRSHLRILSKCIGFSTQPNSFGSKGDISPFRELRRIRIIATRLLHRRMILDRHQISLEESRSWGMLRPDCTSVVVKDARTQAYQLLTAGDARVVTDICSDTWQGETITPLSANDRTMILESSKNWSLADLDVTAFSYAPIPYSYDKMFAVQNVDMKDRSEATYPIIHLIDNRLSGEVPATLHKESGSEDWSLVKNQIFLGLLGSSVRPRRDVAPLIEDCSSAGIRFVYFSPRNMRRTKELASQMGIDISWNCAISLRPLDEGEEADKHRMTSNYADWDVNARLPHGVEAVKRHLKDVDNVPLLVSLFTDVTRNSTSEMVKVFQAYHDIVLSVGLSHISQNDDTFSSSDISFGNDIFFGDEDIINEHNGYGPIMLKGQSQSSLCHKELLFISKIASNSCVFNLSLGQNGLLNMAEILAQGRESLASGVSAVRFLKYSSVVFTLTICCSIFSASTSVPVIPTTSAILYIMVFVPTLAISMQFSNQSENLMTSVPPKNDKSVTFPSGERQRIVTHLMFRSIIPVAGSHLVFLIAFGTLLLDYEADMIEAICGLDSNDSNWTSVVRCRALSKYVGQASLSAGSLMLSELNLCVILQSLSFLFGNDMPGNPVAKNVVWSTVAVCCIAFVFLHLAFVLPSGSLEVLPWYFYLIAFMSPILGLVVSELVKKREKRFEERAEKLRRLQFETRLGMWSPK